MANIRGLKKDINYILGDIIEEVYIWENANPKHDTKESEAIIDEAIATFDSLIKKVNAKNIEGQKLYFKGITTELEKKGRAMIEKINKL